MSLRDVKIGDMVVLPYSDLYAARVAEVTATTKTQFTAGGKRYSKSRGLELGQTIGRFGRVSRASILTPEFETKIAEAKIAYGKRSAVKLAVREFDFAHGKYRNTNSADRFSDFAGRVAEIAAELAERLQELKRMEDECAS